MIQYSILNIPKLEDEEMVNNITIRLDEGQFKGTIVTFDPIQLSEDGSKLQYGLVIQALFVNNYNEEELAGTTIQDVLTPIQLNKFYELIDDVFLDTLKLMKNNIRYGE